MTCLHCLLLHIVFTLCVRAFVDYYSVNLIVCVWYGVLVFVSLCVLCVRNLHLSLCVFVWLRRSRCCTMVSLVSFYCVEVCSCAWF